MFRCNYCGYEFIKYFSLLIDVRCPRCNYSGMRALKPLNNEAQNCLNAIRKRENDYNKHTEQLIRDVEHYRGLPWYQKIFTPDPMR